MPSTGPNAAMPRKSDRTRNAILQAARTKFAAAGYDRASIRAIAQEARIDPAMVMRYFGSKESLFQAAVDSDLQLPNLADCPPASRGRHLTEHFIKRWEADPVDDALALLLRSAVVHSQATRLLREVYERQLIGALRPVVDRAELRHRAGLVASQLLGVALCRYVFGLPGLGDRSIDGLITDVAPTIQRYLTGPLPSRAPGAPH